MTEERLILIQQAAIGDRQAWDHFVTQYTPFVWRVLGKFHNLSQAEKEDLSQEVFTVLLEKGLQAFRGTTIHEFRVYLKTITENKAKSFLRRHGRRLEVLDPFLIDEDGDEGSLPEDPDPTPEEQAAILEQLRGVQRCIQELPAVDQEIFWMQVRGYAYKEMTLRLGMPQGTIGVKFQRAKAKIEECLQKAGLR